MSVTDEVADCGCDFRVRAIHATTAGGHAIESFKRTLDHRRFTLQQSVFPFVRVADHWRAIEASTMAGKTGLLEHLLTAANGSSFRTIGEGFGQTCLYGNEKRAKQACQ